MECHSIRSVLLFLDCNFFSSEFVKFIKAIKRKEFLLTLKLIIKLVFDPSIELRN